MAHELTLPAQVVGPADAIRLRREVETIEGYLEQLALRHKQGQKVELTLPRLSQAL